MTPSAIKSIVVDGRSTARGWAAYKDQTGSLPWLSIAVHFSNWIVIFWWDDFSTLVYRQKSLDGVGLC
jgi:hypothetical protein